MYTDVQRIILCSLYFAWNFAIVLILEGGSPQRIFSAAESCQRLSLCFDCHFALNFSFFIDVACCRRMVFYQKITKFGTLIVLALLYIKAETGELWPRRFLWGVKILKVLMRSAEASRVPCSTPSALCGAHHPLLRTWRGAYIVHSSCRWCVSTPKYGQSQTLTLYISKAYTFACHGAL